jgi:hypothetical protein
MIYEASTGLRGLGPQGKTGFLRIQIAKCKAGEQDPRLGSDGIGLRTSALSTA